MDRETAVRRFIGQLRGFAAALEPQRARQEPGQAALARAAMARLRRVIGKRPGEVAEALPFIVPYLPEPAPGLTAEEADWQREAFFVVGSLFADHPLAGGRGSLGAALYAVQRERGTAVERHKLDDPITRRFNTLLNCTTQRLPDYVREAVSLARTESVPVDWGRLLEDLLDWTAPARRVQLAWATAYWGHAADDEDESEPEPALAGDES